ncbi:unnamed protein product, partial [Vitis vinifera]
MSVGFGKCSKIRHIVRLRQMLRRWRHKAAEASRMVRGWVVLFIYLQNDMIG